MPNAQREDLKHSELQWNGWRQVQNEITFAGGTTNAIGDDGGTQDPFTIFTVAGAAIVKVIGICTTDLAGTGGLEVGVTGSTAGIIALTAGTGINQKEIWHDATPDAFVEASTVLAEKIVSSNIIGTVSTGDITSGVIKFICLWKPLTEDGNVS